MSKMSKGLVESSRLCQFTSTRIRLAMDKDVGTGLDPIRASSKRRATPMTATAVPKARIFNGEEMSQALAVHMSREREKAAAATTPTDSPNLT
jgi:hypothetical protein